MKEGVDYIHDYRGTAIGVGDVVALYYGYGGPDFEVSCSWLESKDD